MLSFYCSDYFRYHRQTLVKKWLSLQNGTLQSDPRVEECSYNNSTGFVVCSTLSATSLKAQ